MYGATRREVDTKRMSSQELDDDRIRIILERQKEQLRAEAKSEIRRHENKANIAENDIRAIKGQIEPQELEVVHTLAGMHSPHENKIYFTKKGQIENEHFVILV